MTYNLQGIVRKATTNITAEYDRLAYITTTTTRITFDYNIKKSTDFENFFTDNINYHIITFLDPILPIIYSL